MASAVVVVILVLATMRIRHVEDEVVARRPERRPGDDPTVPDPAARVVAHAVREDGLEPRQLVAGELHGIIGRLSERVEKLDGALAMDAVSERAGKCTSPGEEFWKNTKEGFAGFLEG